MAATEAATVVTLYVLLDPNALVLRARGLRYRFRSSLEDVVAFSLARCVAVLLAYGFGAGRKYQRCAVQPLWSPHDHMRLLLRLLRLWLLGPQASYHRYLSCIASINRLALTWLPAL